MIDTPADPRVDASGDYFRRSSSARGLSGYREWQHFVVIGGGFEALINFSMVVGNEGPVGRVLVLVRDREWCGGLQRVAAADLDVRAGRADARFGDSSMTFQNGAYSVRAGVRRGPSVDLRLEPRCAPFVAYNLDVCEGGFRSWLTVPRLIADGEIRVGGRTAAVRGAPAYHDHNWGAWGGDTLWQWGFGLPERHEASPWSLVFGQLIDRRRDCILTQSLFLWQGGSLRRIFRDNQIASRSRGLLRVDDPFRLPAIMHLVAPGRLVGVPHHLTIEARAEGDRLDAHFAPDGVAQLLLPRAEDLGTTEIDEVVGAFAASGVVRGRPVELRGRGVFEFVHARA